MAWLFAGVIYTLTYAALAPLLSSEPAAQLLVERLGLLLPPLVSILVIVWRRREWAGRQRVFWDALAAGGALWIAGQVASVVFDLRLDRPIRFVDWIVVPLFCGSLLPLIALIALPHRGRRTAAARTSVLDICSLAALLTFVCWSTIFIVARADQTALSIQVLALLGVAVSGATFLGFFMSLRAVPDEPWASVYRKLALAAAVGLVGALVLAFGSAGTLSAALLGVAWILPFWITAWAAADTPASPPETVRSVVNPTRPEAPTLLFATIVAAPLVGYGARMLLPLGAPFDREREIVTAFMILLGLAAVIIRYAIDRGVLEDANHRVHLLAAACEQSEELIIIGQFDEIRYANSACCRALGWSRKELEGLPPHALVTEAAAEGIAQATQLLSKGEVTRVVLPFARKDHTSFQAACTFAPIPAEGGGTSYFVGLIRDLTDDSRMRAQLIRRERMSAIGQLVSGVAHELNNPLQSVVGTLELLLLEGNAAAVKDDLEQMRREAARATKIIRNLLAFARRPASGRILSDLNEIVQSVLELRRYELAQRNIEIHEHFASDLPVVLVNVEEVQQLVINLIANAQRSMLDANGRGVLTVQTELSGVNAALEVADDGPGVRAELVERIFEPFVTTKEVGDGTGLGLSIAFGIAVAHGGSLELVTVPKGACFRVTLPGSGFPGPFIVH